MNLNLEDLPLSPPSFWEEDLVFVLLWILSSATAIAIAFLLPIAI